MCSVAFKAIYTCIGNKFYFKKDRFLVAYLTDWIKNRHLNLHMKALQCALTPPPLPVYRPSYVPGMYSHWVEVNLKKALFFLGKKHPTLFRMYLVVYIY